VDFRDYDTRLAAYAVVVDREDRVLLALWNEGAEPAWTLPGGGVDLHESAHAAAVREVREETGYDVELTRVLGVDSFVVPAAENADASGRPYKSVRVVFEAQVAGGELTHETDGTTDEARWIPLGEVPALARVPLVDAALELWRATAVRLER
jgi:8-oxo-dGTP diphosphatase